MLRRTSHGRGYWEHDMSAESILLVDGRARASSSCAEAVRDFELQSIYFQGLLPPQLYV